MILSSKALICLILALVYPCYCDWVSGAVLTSVGDDYGWSYPQYYSTFRYQNLYDATWLFARGGGGLQLYNYNYTTNVWRTLSTLPDLADSYNWASDPKYYSTIQVVTIGNNFWLLARNANALLLYTYDSLNNTWTPKQNNTAFSDANQWGMPQYYSTIQAISFSGIIWVFARGPDGERIYQYNPGTNSWSQLFTLAALSDAYGWGNGPQYYSTIQVVNLGNNFYLLGRSANGTELYEFNTFPNTWYQKQGLPELSDANGWAVPEQYSTIQAVALQGKIWLFARGEFGVNVYQYDPSTNAWTNKQSLASLSDANGWDKPQYYETIQAVALNDTIALLSRDKNGLQYHTYSPLTDTWTEQDPLSVLNDLNNWDEPEYYSTIKGVNYDNQITVFARGIVGMSVFRYE